MLEFHYKADQKTTFIFNKEAFNLGNLDSKKSNLLRSFIRDNQGQEILDSFSKIFDLKKLDPDISYLFNEFLKKGLFVGLFKKFPEKFSISDLNVGLGEFLENAAKEGHGNEISSRFKKPLNIESIDYGLLKLLIFMANNGQSNILISLLPETISFIDLNSTYMDSMTLEFLAALLSASSGKSKEILTQIIKKEEFKLRQPIEGSSLEINQNIKIGPDAVELVRNIPIIYNSFKKLRNGWSRFNLEKRGSSTHVFLNLRTRPPKVLFRNYDIQDRSIDAYKKVYKVIPRYVSSPRYLELGNINEKINKLTLRGSEFREVYAGPDLSTLDFENMPSQIRESIELQKQYIMFRLYLEKIQHGHIKDENFNVRFLLIKENGDKVIYFDINEAMKKAQEEKLKIIPIVVLRDWDNAVDVRE